MFGIPYAPMEEDGTSPSGWVIVCPECGQRIPVAERKDFESFTGVEYALHYEQRHADPVDLVVSAGHDEYPLGVGELVWNPYDEAIFDWSQDQGISGTDDPLWRDKWVEVTGLPADRLPVDVDLCWEVIYHVVAPRADVATALRGLATELQQLPSGDDSVFDYWPSGVRLALATAGALGDPIQAEIRASARQLIRTHLAAYALELIPKCNADTLTGVWFTDDQKRVVQAGIWEWNGSYAEGLAPDSIEAGGPPGWFCNDHDTEAEGVEFLTTLGFSADEIAAARAKPEEQQ